MNIVADTPPLLRLSQVGPLDRLPRFPIPAVLSPAWTWIDLRPLLAGD